MSDTSPALGKESPGVRCTPPTHTEPTGSGDRPRRPVPTNRQSSHPPDVYSQTQPPTYHTSPHSEHNGATGDDLVTVAQAIPYRLRHTAGRCRRGGLLWVTVVNQ